MRLNGAIIYVKDLPRMAEFYEVSLRLKPKKETRTDTWVEFDTGVSGLALHAVPADIALKIEMGFPPQPREENPVKLTFEVEDVAAEAARLAAIGCAIRQRPWGVCDAVDPEGNIFQIVEDQIVEDQIVEE
jgi:predicted enzyme related to lactoylglutathione lyase